MIGRAGVIGVIANKKYRFDDENPVYMGKQGKLRNN